MKKMMKKTGMLLMSMCVLLSLSSIVIAQDLPSETKGIYVGLLGGYVSPVDTKTTFTGGGTNVSYDITQEKGYLVGAKVGYLTPFTKKIMALEMEYNHIEHKFDTSKSYRLV